MNDVTVKRDVVYASVDGHDLALDYAAGPSERETGRPIVIYIHGGAWLEGRRNNEGEHLLMKRMAELGFLGVSISYRFSQVATFPAQIQDVWSAVRWLRAHAIELGADGNRIGAWGHSAGGHLAALLGLTAGVAEFGAEKRPIQAVVPISAPTNLATMAGTHDDPDSPESRLIGATVPRARALADRASPVTYANRPGASIPPFLLIHGEADDTVPFSQATELHSILPRSTLLSVGAADHGFSAASADWREFIALAGAFFAHHLW